MDVSYQYLTFFMEDDARLAEVKQVCVRNGGIGDSPHPSPPPTHTHAHTFQAYESGEMLTGELKQELIGVLQRLVSEHQERRKAVTESVVRKFMTPRPLNFNKSKGN